MSVNHDHASRRCTRSSCTTAGTGVVRRPRKDLLLVVYDDRMVADLGVGTPLDRLRTGGRAPVHENGVPQDVA